MYISKDGRTPLIKASREGELDMVKLLLGAGSEVDTKDRVWSHKISTNGLHR